MLSSSMVTIVFRVINFGVFISLLAYGFRRYIYAVLREQMAERDKKRSDLEEKKELLAVAQSHLDERMHTHEQIYKELSATVHAWQQRFEQKQKEQSEEKARITYQLELKMERRREVQLLNRIEDIVVVPAVEESRKALQDYFEEQKHGKAYIKDILAYMESRV